MQSQKRNERRERSDDERQRRQDPRGHERRLPEMRHRNVPHNGIEEINAGQFIVSIFKVVPNFADNFDVIGLN